MKTKYEAEKTGDDLYEIKITTDYRDAFHPAGRHLEKPTTRTQSHDFNGIVVNLLLAMVNEMAATRNAVEYIKSEIDRGNKARKEQRDDKDKDDGKEYPTLQAREDGAPHQGEG